MDEVDGPEAAFAGWPRLLATFGGRRPWRLYHEQLTPPPSLLRPHLGPERPFKKLIHRRDQPRDSLQRMRAVADLGEAVVRDILRARGVAQVAPQPLGAARP